MVDLEKVDIVGGGPAGLYAAILLKRIRPDLHVRVWEQSSPNVTWGFGVVFSERALDFLRTDDPITHDLITPCMESWRDMALVVDGHREVIDGVGFSAVSRLALLQMLQARARVEYVDLHFGQRVESIDALDGDLIIGADGIGSLVRGSSERNFGFNRVELRNYFAWFGTPRTFDTLTQTFIKVDGATLNAHHYRYVPEMSTFIVECDPDSFAALGFADLNDTESAEVCARLFTETLGGAPLVANHSIWRRFPRIWCDTWHVGNRVLLGDAAHTAHYSIGSGTRLAMEDAIALVRALEHHRRLDDALTAYQRNRQPIARKLVEAADSSARWYEDFPRKMTLPSLDFAMEYITRSGRVNPDRLRAMSPKFMSRYDRYRTAAAD